MGEISQLVVILIWPQTEAEEGAAAAALIRQETGSQIYATNTP